jgi:hypothetical protein
MAGNEIDREECSDHREQIRNEIDRIERQSIQRWGDCRTEFAKTDDATKQWLLRVEQKFDRLLWWMMITEASVIITFAFVLLGRLFDVKVI